MKKFGLCYRCQVAIKDESPTTFYVVNHEAREHCFYYFHESCFQVLMGCSSKHFIKGMTSAQWTEITGLPDDTGLDNKNVFKK